MMVAMRTEAPVHLIVPLGLVVVSVLAMCVVILVAAYRDRKKPRTSKLHAFDYPAAFRPHLPQCTRYEDGVCACDEQPDVIAVESFAIDYSPSSGLAVVVIDGEHRRTIPLKDVVVNQSGEIVTITFDKSCR
jgi:hypothetical protein